MNHSNRIIRAALLLSAGLCFGTIATAQDLQEMQTRDQASAEEGADIAAELDTSRLSYSNKWRIAFDNRAKTDGTLVFRMVMQGSDAQPVVVNVPIKNGTGENNAADTTKLALRKAFPKDFKVEGDDGEDVLVKLNFVEGRSSLELLSNDVKGLKVKIRKE